MRSSASRRGTQLVGVSAETSSKRVRAPVSARWWAHIFDDATVHLDINDNDGSVYAWFDQEGVEYGFHPADDRNPRGGSPVVYWAVDNLTTARDELLAAGCTHHRGPLRVDEHRQICQLTDPFGTIIGLDGP